MKYLFLGVVYLISLAFTSCGSNTIKTTLDKARDNK